MFEAQRQMLPADGNQLNLRAGDLVQVKSRKDIIETLDAQGCLDDLPFMPEMLKYCGQTLRVYKRADKTCDTLEKSGARRMLNAVHLEGVRCDGIAHGGCQAECLMFWKEAWLRRFTHEQSVGVEMPQGDVAGEKATVDVLDGNAASLEAVYRSVYRHRDDVAPEKTIYKCQITELLRATRPLAWWDVRQYARDFFSGNTTLWELGSAFGFWCFRQLLKLGGYRILVGIYNRIQFMRGGVPYPYESGRLSKGTPSDRLDLKVGDLVRVKSHEEILATLDRNNKNRGLWFDAEQVPYCGKITTVRRRVERILNEKTGQMMHFKNDCLMLDNVYCRAQYSYERKFCPRSIYSYWREVWLTKVE